MNLVSHSTMSQVLSLPSYPKGAEEPWSLPSSAGLQDGLPCSRCRSSADEKGNSEIIQELPVWSHPTPCALVTFSCVCPGL